MERLQKIIARAGIASRRAAEKLILAGEVYVDGKQVKELGVQADPAVNKIVVQGRPVCLEEQLVYYMLYKPRGYLSTVKDERARKTVLDLFPEDIKRIYPVGRLDYNTEGLLLLTNDGALTNRLLHPARLIGKTYLCKINGVIDEPDIKKLREGVSLSDGITAEAEVKLLDTSFKAKTSVLRLRIHEGRNRQIRRMMDAVGYKVISLKRIEFAGLNLSGMKPGQYRELTSAEIAYISSL